MTITAQTSKNGPYSGNGSTVSFDFTFYTRVASDLVVTLLSAAGVQTVLTLNVNYTVSGVGVPTGGAVVLNVAPTIGQKLVITRLVAITQEMDLQNLAEVSPEELEVAYDKLTQIAQDQQEQLSRAVKVDRFNTTNLEQLTAYINALGPIATDISAVANIDEDVVTVADNLTNITTVADVSAAVTTVAGNTSNINAVVANATNINTVATNIANVNTVGTNIADVTNFADVYLGARATEPTTRSDGSALEAGDLYFNTVGDAVWIYDGAAWVKGYARGDAIFDSVQFTGGTGTQGLVSWNTDEETLDLIQNGATLQIGQETQVHVRNNSGATIANGTPVMATGSLGASGRITVAKMDGTVPSNAQYLVGIATEDIPNGEDGKVTSFGKVRHINTNNSAIFTGTIANGDVLYIDPATAGKLTNVAPSFPNMHMHIAFVIHAANNGTLMVRVTPINENEFQPYTSVLAGTTASFTTTLKTKLDGIEAGADVTDTANVSAALGTSGATAGEVLSWDGAAFDWIAAGGAGSLTSVALTQPSSVTVNSASTAFTINQTGAGAALLVEDETSPDTSPFIVTATGQVGIGTRFPSAPLNIYSATSTTALLSGDAFVSLNLSRASTDFGGPILAFRKYRGTQAAPTAVTANNVTATMNFQAWDGANLIGTSQIETAVDAFSAADNLSGNIKFSTRPLGAGAVLAERLRIGGAGQFGIGGANYGTSGQTIVSGGSAAAPAWGALPVSGGGTGVTTSTGTGSNVLSDSPALTGTPTAPTAAAGTNTTQVATTAFVQAAAVYPFKNVQLFTTSTTWTVPAGVTSVFAFVIGGGGGGAGGSAQDSHGSGGLGGSGAGTVTVSSSVTVTVGAGGAGSTSTSGSAGGSSIFSSITATGGGGGINAGANGANGSATGAQLTSTATFGFPQLFAYAISNTTVFSVLKDWLGPNERPRGTNSALAYTAACGFQAGTKGLGEVNNLSSGGVGGAVLIFY